MVFRNSGDICHNHYAGTGAAEFIIDHTAHPHGAGHDLFAALFCILFSTRFTGYAYRFNHHLSHFLRAA